VISERYERKSTIITSNLDVPEWAEAFPNRILGAATVDRILHGAYKVVLDGNKVTGLSIRTGNNKFTVSKRAEY